MQCLGKWSSGKKPSELGEGKVGRDYGFLIRYDGGMSYGCVRASAFPASARSARRSCRHTFGII